MKLFHIITFGCQMNEHDSEHLAGILEAQGLLSADLENADLVILNTCSIREKAEQKFYSELGRLKQLKSEKPRLFIAVAGCIAQQEGANLLSRAPFVDMVLGTSDLARLPDMVSERQFRPVPLVETAGDPQYHLKRLPASRVDRVKAWVSIMYGCDNFCTYCVVPYLRGRERSRPPQDIITEVRELAEAGYKEVTLLGQNVNSYGKGLEHPLDFPMLLQMVNDDTNIKRIRFVTSHPRDLSDGLIAAFQKLPKLCDALHLPVQSGSNTMLSAMNRGYTREAYLEKVAKLRQAVPDIALTTDVIVGFPGETGRDFEMTMNLLEEVRFDGIFAFKYSKRPGTAALKLSDHVQSQIKEKRLSDVLSVQKHITLENNKKQVNTVAEVLFDGRSKRGGTLSGRTRGNKVVNVEAPVELIGTLTQVRITAAGMNSLIGQICE